MLSGDKDVINSGGNNSLLSIKPALWSYTIMAFAGMGDALLYAHLPVNGASLGMSAFSIGLFLSANKFIRIFSNRWIAKISVNLGTKTTLKLGIILAGITTLVYALDPVFILWLLSRIFWGIAYSALRFSTLQYAGASNSQGSALGIGGSIKELGSVAAYLIGPALLNGFGANFTFTILGVLTMALFPLAFILPNFVAKKEVIAPFRFSFPQVENIWFFVATFVVEGLLVVGISKIVNYEIVGSQELLIITAYYISFRRICNIIVAPIAGWMSDRWGFQKIFNISGFFLVVGLTLIPIGMANTGIIICFLGASINFTLIPLFALNTHEPKTALNQLTNLVTFRDIGSAFGSLSGLYLLNLFKINLIFGVLCFLLLILWYYLIKTKNYERRY